MRLSPFVCPEVPMIGHQAIRTNPHRLDFKRLLHDALERREITVVIENPHPPHATIQDLEYHSPWSDS